MKINTLLQERFYLLLYHIMVVYCSSGPVMDQKSLQMTACEYSVHTKCVMKLGQADKFVKNCDQSDVIKCLKEHVVMDICRIDDFHSLSTINALVEQIERRFIRNKKCADERFLKLMQDHFIVLGEVIEHSEAVKHKKVSVDVMSGSGSVPDDTEDDDDDEDDGSRDQDGAESNDGTNMSQQKNVIQKISPNNVSNDTKTKTDEIKYWQENAKKNLKLRKKQKKTILVFFDDNQKRNKLREENKEKRIPKPVYSAWEKLKREYEQWFQRSRFNLKS